ncbi:hypothetical protein B0A55_01458 [Friedmanniomyces simplex]|uniref:C2H2-type domain-containing protein n=1 Tax=Friedmanniomyces simplex TaxID=329884 RepID=A0A4U0XZV5_9PEZI|nr:hypothetical protein B0A55_01458 [Friedmanniomyces simplex]
MSSSTPSIRISQHHRYLNSPTYPSPFASSPMAIPRAQDPVPPPLPPPSYIPNLSAGHDPGWQWGNDPNGSDFGRAAPVKPGSSLLGGGLHGFRQEQERDVYAQRAAAEARRGSSISTVTVDRDYDMGDEHTAHSDEDGNGSRLSSNYRLQSERQLEQRTLEASSNTYDKQLLSRIGGPNTPKRQSVSHSAGLPDAVPLSQNSFDHSMFVNEDLMEEGQMGNLNIHDRSPSGSDDFQLKTGTKRRASSPPREGAREQRSSISSASGHNEVFRRSIPPNQHSPISRFHPNQSSISSTSSLGPRHGSLGSSLGIASIPSSATSYGSNRLSPGAASPAVDPALRLGAPYESARALPPTHQRTLSESTPAGGRDLSADSSSMTHSQHGSSASHLQGIFICECCPKKPKKFDTQEELRLHESEKQYTCAYCPNRFKNKNEAERHQNSLHLRKHSWSCAALSGPEAAFHPTTVNGADVCGYCGDDFSNPPQWDLRAEHLNHVHKFGECNHAKKFFRADHFRQHLKHSHAGTSGKWTNLLEAACMKDEPPPEKRVTSSIVVAEGGPPPPALMVTTTGLGASASHGVLAETPHDS